jgi:hypothetical protein
MYLFLVRFVVSENYDDVDLWCRYLFNYLSIYLADLYSDTIQTEIILALQLVVYITNIF